MRRTRWMLIPAVAVGLLCFTRPAKALFGEDIPYLISMVSKEIEQIALIRQNIGIVRDNFDLAVANVKSLGTKQGLRVFGMTAWNQAQAMSRYGEGAGYSVAMSGRNPASVPHVYSSSTIRLPNTTFLQGSQPGQSARLANLANIEEADAAYQNCLSAVATYRQMQERNRVAQARLEATQFDASKATNSEVEQLNLVNAAQAAAATEARAQGTVQSCQAEQQTVSNMFERNREAYLLTVQSEMAKAKAQNALSIDPDATVTALTHMTP